MVKVLRVYGIMEIAKIIASAEEAYCEEDCLEEDEYGEVRLNRVGWDRVQIAFRNGKRL